MDGTAETVGRAVTGATGGTDGGATGSTVGVRRPRRVRPETPGGELVLEAPPEPERVVPGGMAARLLPLLMVLGSVGFVAMRPEDPTSWLFGGMFAMSSVGMLAGGGGGRGAGARTASMDEDRRDYLRYLDVLDTRVRRISTEQRHAGEHVHPHPAAWPDVLAADRLWERRPSDPDFGRLRVGCGPQRLATRLTPPQTGPVEGLEPISALALRRFLRRNAVVPDLPVAVDARASATIRLEPDGSGDQEPARALARALVAQYVLWHSPADAQLAVVARPGVFADWEWTKWLPHVAHPRLTDAVGPVRMLATNADAVRGWWVGEPSAAGRHLLVVVDGVDPPGPWAAVSGVTVLRVDAPSGRRAAPSVVRLTVGAERLVRPGDGAGDPQPIGQPDRLAVAEARALARRLARYRPGDTVTTGPDGQSSPTGLPDLLGLGAITGERVTVLRARRRASRPDRLRVPLGTDAAGRPVLLDLKESAQGGSGPHGLCIGATGSGKSELLRTLVVGLVTTHAADELNLVLVDFKGGATFLGFADLPHVSAVITNLADELTLVDRMGDAIAGEITRRQEVLRAAGNLASLADYELARRTPAGAALPPLPALLIVVDEFSELISQKPDMVELMVTVGRLGRSLGVHLLFASQRLDEGRLRGLESHLSYRIALRTFSASESRAVLGVPDAHQLPPTPGAAFLAAGTDELVRFRAAYVSGAPAGARDAGSPVRRSRPVALPFRAGPVTAPAAGPATTRPTGSPTGSPDGAADSGPVPASVLDLLVAALDGPGPRAHRVWLPPLGVPPPLTEVLGPVGPVAGRGLQARGPVGRLAAPVGLVDRPYQQRRDPWVLDLSGSAGHLAVVGGPRSGKSTALRTVLLSLACTHTPPELGIHVLDFGGGALGPLAGLPHVGTVADRQQPDLVRRTLAELSAAVDRRERLFRDAGVPSVDRFRRRRAEGGFPEEPATDLLLVLDGYLTLRSEFPDLEDRFTALATRGLAYGVHVALTTGRWTEIRPALKDLLGSRIELRLGEPADSEVDRRRAAGVPARAGHGLAPDGEPAVLAAPVLTGTTDGSGDDASAAVRAVADGWPGVGVAPVRLLPDRIDVAELPAGPGAGPVIGIDEDRLAAVELDPAEPHLLCFADAGSGKTTLLRVLARGICERFGPEQARIVLVDHRRTMLGAVPDTHLIGYATSATATAEAAAEIAGSLGRRLPGPDVTPRQLRERSWWSGPDVWLLVDDYDLVAPSGGTGAHPLLALVEFLPQATDVGLHVVLARRCGGAGRALFDPVLGRLRELGTPGLVGHGSPDEGALVESVKPAVLQPGRAVLADRRRGPRRLQLAWLEPDPG